MVLQRLLCCTGSYSEFCTSNYGEHRLSFTSIVLPEDNKISSYIFKTLQIFCSQICNRIFLSYSKIALKNSLFDLVHQIIIEALCFKNGHFPVKIEEIFFLILWFSLKSGSVFQKWTFPCEDLRNLFNSLV